MFWKELIGIAATLLVFVSMTFPTLTYKGSFWMRILNIIGSVVFVVYGALLPAISTAVLNGGLIIVNSYHLYKLIKANKNSKKENIQTKEGENNQ